MMAVIIATGFSGQWLLALLGLPIFLSTILGVQFTLKEQISAAEAKIVTMKIHTRKVRRVRLPLFKDSLQKFVFIRHYLNTRMSLSMGWVFFF